LLLNCMSIVRLPTKLSSKEKEDQQTLGILSKGIQ
jgi:hypothetical protein